MKAKEKPSSKRVGSDAGLCVKKPRAWQVVLDTERKVQAMDMEDGTFSFRFLNGNKKTQIRISREAVIAMQALISHGLDAEQSKITGSEGVRVDCRVRHGRKVRDENLQSTRLLHGAV